MSGQTPASAQTLNRKPSNRVMRIFDQVRDFGQVSEFKFNLFIYYF